MGTIDISYYNLFIGLLLLAIPFFYLWKFKTGLLKPAVIGTLRMIIQLFFIGIYLKYLFLWNNPWINFLWVIIMIFVAGQTALVRTQLKRSILPGTMIGQILGGSSPNVAIKYQMMIMVITFTASMLSLMITISLASRRSFDAYGKLLEVTKETKK